MAEVVAVRVAIYARVSTSKGTQDPEMQLSEAREYASRRGFQIAEEYVDSGGIVLNFPLGALAHLGLGRAYALDGEVAKARTAYQQFLTLWKDADSDIPILHQARTEIGELP